MLQRAAYRQFDSQGEAAVRVQRHDMKGPCKVTGDSVRITTTVVLYCITYSGKRGDQRLVTLAWQSLSLGNPNQALGIVTFVAERGE
jgi:hypothetical protein